MAGVAILGFGTVGSGAAEILINRKAALEKQTGTEVFLKYIVELREIKDSPFADRIIRTFETVEQDPEVRVVAECIGGTGIAYEFAKRSLQAGKHFVTSNKALVAAYGTELLHLAEENHVHFLFEAAVGGGIPIIKPLRKDLCGNEINEVYGILNGTTNYILTKMIHEDMSFETALSQAQALGYAEADPTADVEGIDVCRKICILSALAFGRKISTDDIPTVGITGLVPEDISLAKKAGYNIKLLGRTMQKDGKICCYVSPHLISDQLPLACIEDVFNGVVASGNFVGDVTMIGKGAGKLPTGSAIVSDIAEALMTEGKPSCLSWTEAGKDDVISPDEIPMRWFLRLAPNAEPSHYLAVKTIQNDNCLACITSSVSRNDLPDDEMILSRIPILDPA